MRASWLSKYLLCFENRLVRVVTIFQWLKELENVFFSLR